MIDVIVTRIVGNARFRVTNKFKKILFSHD